MGRAEQNPPRISRLALNSQVSADLLVLAGHQRLIIEDLADPKAELAVLGAGVGQTLDFGDIDDA